MADEEEERKETESIQEKIECVKQLIYHRDYGERTPGGWEKHTSGVGTKIMEKMGCTGTLGIRGGITTPLMLQDCNKWRRSGEKVGPFAVEED